MHACTHTRMEQEDNNETRSESRTRDYWVAELQFLTGEVKATSGGQWEDKGFKKIHLQFKKSLLKYAGDSITKQQPLQIFCTLVCQLNRILISYFTFLDCFPSAMTLFSRTFLHSSILIPPMFCWITFTIRSKGREEWIQQISEPLHQHTNSAQRKF